MTANQDLFDAALRHQVALRRYSDRKRRQMLDLLEAADADLVAKLRARLGAAMEGGATNRRLNALLKEVRDTRRALIDSLAQDTASEMEALAAAEAAWEQQIMADSIPVEMSTVALPLERLRAAAINSPMQGKRLRDWFKHLGDGDRARLDQAVRLGVANGETLDDIVRRIAGTRANGYTDGILATTRREAETIARTAVNHTSNAARSEVWDANQDIIWGLRWTATLDGRTSPICQARDGAIAVNPGREIPPGTDLLDPQDARPPGHRNCRSLMVAMLAPDMIIGDRPFVSDDRTREQREKDFRREARDADPEAWKAMSPADRNAEVKRIRDKWGDENIGTVPASTTYEEWMRRQAPEFQDATLGPSRAEMFRNGDATLDQFVDVGGRTRTLSELDTLVRPAMPSSPAAVVRDLGQDGNEHFLLMDAGGNEVYRGTSGKARVVEFSEVEIQRMSRPNAGLILHHNHPAAVTSFSPADLSVFSRLPGLQEMWAHAYQASFRIGRNTKTKRLHQRHIDKARKNADLVASRAYNDGGDIGRLIQMKDHITARLLSRRGFFEYDAEFPEDYEQMDLLIDEYL